jgi:hypothetical protein
MSVDNCACRRDSPDYRQGMLAYLAHQTALAEQGRVGSVFAFEDLPEQQRTTWIAVARAVAADVLNTRLAVVEVEHACSSGSC